MPKLQVIKEEFLRTALKDDFLTAFKEDNNGETSTNITEKKIVRFSKVFDWLIRLLVILLKEKVAWDFLLQEQLTLFGVGAA